MIQGLSLPPHIEDEVWKRFEHWSEVFKERLRRNGVDGLLEEYEVVIRSVEAQSCFHGPGGSLVTGENWQWCCGVSYEYWNDIAVRDSLAVFMEVVPADETLFRQRVAALDARLRTLIEMQAETSRWWERLPRGVIE